MNEPSIEGPSIVWLGQLRFQERLEQAESLLEVDPQRFEHG